MRTFLAIFLISFVVSFISTKFLIFFNIKKFLDVPDRMRKIHHKPVLRAGGISVYIGVLASVLALFFYQNKLTAGFILKFETFKIILIPASLIFLLGLLDDAIGLSARVKLPFQVLAASLLFFEGIKIEVIKLPFLGTLNFGYFSFFITILWIVGITNGFNFIDGMDGLASGISFFASLTIFLISLIKGDYIISLFTLSLCGAIAGFFKFNWHPAEIFLGDSGSYFLGFLIGSLSIVSSTKSSAIVAITIPLLVLAYPLLDLLLAVFRRLLSKRSIFAADKEHIHHKLLERGYSYKGAIFLLYLISGVFGLLAIFSFSINSKLFAFLIPVFSGIFAIYFVRKLGYEEFKKSISNVEEEVKREKLKNSYIENLRTKIRNSTEPDLFLNATISFFEDNFGGKYFLYFESKDGKKISFGNSKIRERTDKTGELFFKISIESKALRKSYLMFSISVNETIYEDFLNDIFPIFLDRVKFFGTKLIDVRE